MSSPFDNLLDQLTARLGADPELRLEVRRELASHLDDARAEFLAAGDSDDAASANAIKALGSPEQLAEQLFQANRSRMRWRKIFRRFALVALVPLALLVTFWPQIYSHDALPSSAGELWSMLRVGWHLDDSDTRTATWRDGLEEKIDRLPADQQFLFRGNPGDKEPWQIARSIAQRWPENPVYWAQYVQAQLLNHQLPMGFGRSNLNEQLPAAAFEKYLADIAHGQELEPNNAWYDFLRAAVLLRISTEIIPNHGPTVRTVGMSKDGAFVDNRSLDELRVLHPVRFEQALQAFDIGVHKRVITSHAVEMRDIRRKLLGQPRTLGDFYDRWYGDTLFFSSSEVGVWRHMEQGMALYALNLSQSGDTAHSTAWLDRLEIFATLYGRGAHDSVDLLTARPMQQWIMNARIAAWDFLDQPDEAQAALQKSLSMATWFVELEKKYGVTEDQLKHYDRLMESMIIFPLLKLPDPEPLRTAEHAVYQKGSIQEGLIVMDFFALWIWLFIGILALRERNKPDKTPMLWIGWRRLGWVGIWALAVPIGIYVLYVWSPWSERHLGVRWVYQRIMLEHALLFLTIFGLSMTLTWRATKNRARELALPTNALFRKTMAPVLALGVIVLGVTVYTTTYLLESRAVERATRDAYEVAHEVDDSALRLVRDEMAQRYVELMKAEDSRKQ